MESVRSLIKKLLVKSTHLINKKFYNRTLFFVHIPKTAGTSFRKSLEEKYETVNDYGANNPHNHPALNEFIYDKKDPFGLLAHLKNRYTWIAGHVWIDKYISFAMPHDIVTFVREPVERTLSHFNHEVRWGDGVKDLESFIESNKAQNTQARFLRGLPVSLIGFVGVTERYNDSIKLINEQYQIKIQHKVENTNDNKHLSHDNISQELKDKVLALNLDDNTIYLEAQNILDARMAFAQSGRCWTWMYATVNPHGLVSGIAYRVYDEPPVPLVIKHEGISIAEFNAAELTRLFPGVNFPRERFVGFELKIPHQYLKQGELTLTCSDTEQQINVLKIK